MITKDNYFAELKELLENSFYWKNLGITFDCLEEGFARVKLKVDDDVINYNNTLHGGAIASLMDISISSTLRSMRIEQMTTVSLTTNFINPGKRGKTVYATSTVVSSKKRMQYLQSTVVDEDGMIIANGTAVFLLLQNKP